MSFYMNPPAFLANDPEWAAKYAKEYEAMQAAYARAGELAKVAGDLHKKAAEAKAARLEGKKADSAETWQERITAAEAKAAGASRGADGLAQNYFKAWASDGETLATLSRAALTKCVEAGRTSLATYAEAFADFSYAIQRINTDGEYEGQVLNNLLTRGIQLNNSSKVADAIKYLTDSTEALAKRPRK